MLYSDKVKKKLWDSDQKKFRKCIYDLISFEKWYLT